MGQRKSGHVTLLDIAQACGFSVSTVSIVLSEAPLSQNVAASTTRTHPHNGAPTRLPSRCLRALLAPSPQPDHCRSRVRSFRPVLHSHRARHSGRPSAGEYLPLLVDAQTQRKLFDSYLQHDPRAPRRRRHRDRQLDLRGNQPARRRRKKSSSHRHRRPRSHRARRSNSLLVDNEAGGALAMRHLIDLGHRRSPSSAAPKNCLTLSRDGRACNAPRGSWNQHRSQLVFQLPTSDRPDLRF